MVPLRMERPAWRREACVWSLALIHRPSLTLCRDVPGAISHSVVRVAERDAAAECEAPGRRAASADPGVSVFRCTVGRGYATLLHGGLDVFGGDGFRLGDGGGEEGAVREAVGLARQAAGRLEDRLDGGGFEEAPRSWRGAADARCTVRSRHAARPRT